MDIRDPFADEPKQDKVVAEEKTPAFDYASVIRRLAEIDDELNRREISPLEKERDKLKKALKQQMLKDRREMAYDETSNWEAVIVQRSSDVWDVGALKSILSPRQRERYILESPATGAIEDGIKSGDLSRPTLEKAGAVTKKAGAQALYVRERKDDHEA